jgi:hypothetical protein
VTPEEVEESVGEVEESDGAGLEIGLEIGVVRPDEFVDCDVEDDVEDDAEGSVDDDVKVLDVVVEEDVLDAEVVVEDDASGAAEGFCASPDLAEVSADRCTSVCWISE